MDKICVVVNSDSGPKKVCIDSDYKIVSSKGLDGVQKIEHRVETVDKGKYYEYHLIREGSFDITWIMCYRRENGLFLDHLETPENSSGYGKLGLALFYAMLGEAGAEGFGVRLGGGENTKNFLKYIGFESVPSDFIHEIRDNWSAGNYDYSVAVGKLKQENPEGHTSKLGLIPVEYFPNEFFESNMNTS